MSDSSRSLRADARRNHARVIEAAYAVLARDGLAASMREIARHAGVGLATVYRQFPTKEALYDAIITERTYEHVRKARQLAHAENVGDAFFEFFAYAVESATGQKMLVDALAAAGIDPSPGLAEANQERMDATAVLLVCAQQRGTVRTDVTVEEVAALLTAACLAAERQQWDDGFRARMLNIFFDGLRPHTTVD